MLGRGGDPDLGAVYGYNGQIAEGTFLFSMGQQWLECGKIPSNFQVRSLRFSTRRNKRAGLPT